MIAALARTMLQPGDTVVTVVPSFGLHEIEPLALGARVLKVPMALDMGFALEPLADAIAAGPRLVFLGSPWNPVGPALDTAALERLTASVRPGTLFVLDEAYHEYAPRDLIPDGLEFLTAVGIDHVVLRTFSKAYGLAGLRVGDAVCSDGEIARVLRAAKTPFNVNAAAQVAARAALADQAWMEDSVARCGVERERLAADLRGLELRVAPSATNFLFFDSGQDSATVADWLLSQGIIVKPWREPGYTSWLRVTIGHRADNERFVAALAQALREAGH
jgi:histidinol-phosphate aminotransferase